MVRLTLIVTLLLMVFIPGLSEASVLPAQPVFNPTVEAYLAPTEYKQCLTLPEDLNPLWQDKEYYPHRFSDAIPVFQPNSLVPTAAYLCLFVVILCLSLYWKNAFLLFANLLFFSFVSISSGGLYYLVRNLDENSMTASHIQHFIRSQNLYDYLAGSIWRKNPVREVSRYFKQKHIPLLIAAGRFEIAAAYAFLDNHEQTKRVRIAAIVTYARKLMAESDYGTALRQSFSAYRLSQEKGISKLLTDNMTAYAMDLYRSGEKAIADEVFRQIKSVNTEFLVEALLFTGSEYAKDKILKSNDLSELTTIKKELLRRYLSVRSNSAFINRAVAFHNCEFAGMLLIQAGKLQELRQFDTALQAINNINAFITESELVDKLWVAIQSQKAEQFYFQGDLVGAIELMSAAIARYPKERNLHCVHNNYRLKAARESSFNRDIDKALHHLDKIDDRFCDVDLVPHAEIYNRFAEQNMQAGRYGIAHTLFEKTINLELIHNVTNDAQRGIADIRQIRKLIVKIDNARQWVPELPSISGAKCGRDGEGRCGQIFLFQNGIRIGSVVDNGNEVALEKGKAKYNLVDSEISGRFDRWFKQTMDYDARLHTAIEKDNDGRIDYESVEINDEITFEKQYSGRARIRFPKVAIHAKTDFWPGLFLGEKAGKSDPYGVISKTGESDRHLPLQPDTQDPDWGYIAEVFDFVKDDVLTLELRDDDGWLGSEHIDTFTFVHLPEAGYKTGARNRASVFLEVTPTAEAPGTVYLYEETLFTDKSHREQRLDEIACQSENALALENRINLEAAVASASAPEIFKRLFKFRFGVLGNIINSMVTGTLAGAAVDGSEQSSNVNLTTCR